VVELNMPDFDRLSSAVADEYSGPARYLELICHLAAYTPLLVTVAARDTVSLQQLANAVVSTYGKQQVCQLHGAELTAASNGSQLLMVAIADALGLTQLPTDEIAARETVLETARIRVQSGDPLLVVIEHSERLTAVALNEIAQLALMASQTIAFCLFGTSGFDAVIKDGPTHARCYRIELPVKTKAAASVAPQPVVMTDKPEADIPLSDGIGDSLLGMDIGHELPVSVSPRPKKSAPPPLLDIAAFRQAAETLLAVIRSRVSGKFGSRESSAAPEPVRADYPSDTKQASARNIPVPIVLGLSGVLAVVLLLLLYAAGNDNDEAVQTRLPPVVLNGSGATGNAAMPSLPGSLTAGSENNAGLTKMEPAGSYRLSDSVESAQQSRYVESSAARTGNSAAEEVVRSQAVMAAVDKAARTEEVEQPRILLPAPAKSVATPVAKPPAANKSVAANNTATGRLAPLLTARSGSYVMQMLGSSDRKSAQNFVTKWSGQVKSGLYWFETVRDGKPWFVVSSGAYPDKKAATAAVAQLPQQLRSQSPWVREVGQIQQQINLVPSNKK
jgi:DamX protein